MWLYFARGRWKQRGKPAQSHTRRSHCHQELHGAVTVTCWPTSVPGALALLAAGPFSRCRASALPPAPPQPPSSPWLFNLPFAPIIGSES